MPNYMDARTDVSFHAISKDRKDIGKFNTPSLRDLKYTGPYMHNGVFTTLDPVVVEAPKMPAYQPRTFSRN